LKGKDFAGSKGAAMNFGGYVDKFPADILGKFLLARFENSVELVELLDSFRVH
jgi:hypothetical protein